MCCGELQTRTHGLGSRLRFRVKPVFPFPPCAYYLCLRWIPYPSLWSYPRNHSLVNSWESQGHAAATRVHIFGHCICSKLKYGECNKYVHCSRMNKSLWTKCLCCMWSSCYRYDDVLLEASTKTGARILKSLPTPDMLRHTILTHSSHMHFAHYSRCSLKCEWHEDLSDAFHKQI